LEFDGITARVSDYEAVTVLITVIILCIVQSQVFDDPEHAADLE